MDPLVIAATDDTPFVSLNAKEGNFELMQRSLPEDSTAFYAPVIEWMLNYAASPLEDTKFLFHLEYFNTSLAKQIFKLLNILEQIAKKKNVLVTWCYDKGDHDMLASGERYSRLTVLKFEMVEKG